MSTERDNGYECGKCGYMPTEKELRSGVCPECFRHGQAACQQAIGYVACRKPTPKGNCRMPTGHEGDCT